MLELGSALDLGRKRAGKENQDSIGIVKPGLFNWRPPLLIVADGMGGYQGGALASRLVVQHLSAGYLKTPPTTSPLQALQFGITNAHHALRAEASRDLRLAQMGSTVVAVVIKGENVFLANVGDSRAYIINQNEVKQISYDHSLVGEQLRLGLITEAEVRTHPRRNVLTMSISAQREQVEIFTATFTWKPKDILVLCSDGLWGPVVEPQIQAVVTELPPRLAAQKLVELANSNQGPDNISVIVARYS